MQESLEKYLIAERVRTNPLIDDPAIVFAGRTLQEILLAAAVFVFESWFANAPLSGLVLCFVTVWLLPLYRTKFPPGFLAHVAWALGLNKPKSVPCGKLFTLKQSVARFGP